MNAGEVKYDVQCRKCGQVETHTLTADALATCMKGGSPPGMSELQQRRIQQRLCTDHALPVVVRLNPVPEETETVRLTRDEMRVILEGLSLISGRFDLYGPKQLDACDSASAKMLPSVKAGRT